MAQSAAADMAEKIIKTRRDDFPPFFWSDFTDADKKILRSNPLTKDFDLDFVRAVASRCRFGCPQVLVCSPAMSDGTPFPTVFWLVCPYLDNICSELEAGHKIPELETELEAKEAEVLEWHKAYAELRENLAEENGDIKKDESFKAARQYFKKCGVGGISFDKPCTAKCLHLQAATLLGWRRHPAAKWLKSMLGNTECAFGDCEIDGQG